ncbi:hypothetical protein F9278_10240 [Streptomyces phaeolivaceus]|uniref:Uncharacterized protein n=1 Tax=Streptomyces phaeolivaceus TaxID=2653200 RepID=A0A5P8K0M4_9ACTN|nr:hypothetical protein [Streptomyces phaeolivaceus]QFQ96530.1 hypothetical protein F9278_10240 [Streptomyces phaeolivaceus]
MATGGAPRRPGAALGPTLLIGVLVTGCAAGTTDGRTDGRGGSPSASATPHRPSPSATPPEALCARIVAHWAREVLDGGTYGDYQSMGLSNGQYDVLRAVVDAARAEKERAGPTAAERLIVRRARADCRELYRSGGPGGGPWS